MGDAQDLYDEKYEKMTDDAISRYESLTDEEKAKSGYKPNSYRRPTEKEMEEYLLNYAKERGINFKDMNELTSAYRNLRDQYSDENEYPYGIWTVHTTPETKPGKVAAEALQELIYTDEYNKEKADKEFRSQFSPMKPKIEHMIVDVPNIDKERELIKPIEPPKKLEYMSPTQTTTPNSNLTRNKYDEGSKMPAIETKSKYENNQ